MKTILFISELGAGLGHVSPLLAIAKALRDSADRDPKFIFAVNDPLMLRPLHLPAGDLVLPLPELKQNEPLSSHSKSYAEILAHHGFTRAEVMTPLLALWDDLLSLIKPDLIIADHSPTAILAARGRIPVLQTGSGYTMPPADLPIFPALRSAMGAPTMQPQMLDALNAVLKLRKQPLLPSLPALLATEGRALFSHPILDPYAGMRPDPYLGTYNQGIAPTTPVTSPSVFLYAGARPDYLGTLVQALMATGLPIRAYLGPRETAATSFLRMSGAEVFKSPPALAEVFAISSVIVSHGGAGLTLAAMQAGRAQVILPIHAEAEFNASRIVSNGLGLAVEDPVAETITDAVKNVAEVRRITETTQMIAAQAPKHLVVDPMASITKQVKALAGF